MKIILGDNYRLACYSAAPSESNVIDTLYDYINDSDVRQRFDIDYVTFDSGLDPYLAMATWYNLGEDGTFYVDLAAKDGLVAYLDDLFTNHTGTVDRQEYDDAIVFVYNDCQYVSIETVGTFVRVSFYF